MMSSPAVSSATRMLSVLKIELLMSCSAFTVSLPSASTLELVTFLASTVTVERELTVEPSISSVRLMSTAPPATMSVVWRLRTLAPSPTVTVPPAKTLDPTTSRTASRLTKVAALMS